MTVLDAYAVIAYLGDEAAASEVSRLLSAPCLLPLGNMAEVVDRLRRLQERSTADILFALEALERSGVSMAPTTFEGAFLAGVLRARHYHRERCPVSLADCFTAATALRLRQPLATADPALADLCEDEGGDVIRLPDTDARRP